MVDSLVSIVTPSYNQAQFISQMLKSVDTQTHPHIEHIVVDGGSDDETIPILESHDPSHEFVWVSEPDEGQADAISKGYEMASGDIYCWLNCDDVYLHSDVLAIIADTFNKHDVEIVSGRGIHIDGRGDYIRPFEQPGSQINYNHLRYRYTIFQPATFVRAKAATSVALDTSLTYAFDWAYFAELFRKHEVKVIDDELAGYRVWGKNKTSVGGVDRAVELKAVTETHLGPESWQARVLGLYVTLLEFGESLPWPVGGWIQSATHTASSAVRELSGYRITAV